MKFLLKMIALFFAGANFAFAAVHLNTATQAELETLKGVGPTKAKSIIEYREQNGAFQSVDDLKKVKGFGDKSVESLKNDLHVGEEPQKGEIAPNETLPAKPAAKMDKSEILPIPTKNLKPDNATK